MNALTGVDNLFHVSPEPSACTAGADLSPILMGLPDFKRGSRVAAAHHDSGSAHPTIAFVDMEGLGDKSGEHHVRLATPFLIISKVVIYNWKGMPNKQTMLEELLVMVEAVDKVSPGEATFGTLIILMRDVERGAEDIKDILMEEESTEGYTFKEKKLKEERNLIRRGLQAAFRSITVHLLPCPHQNIEGGGVRLSEVTPAFSASLDVLRGSIA
ncbi:unnamed protein product, partial [Ectocarpus fasciculatus]